VVVLRSLVCLVIQPALFFGMIKLAELTGTIAQATFVGSTMPPATLSFMFAQQHATYETESVARVGHIDRRIDRHVEPNRPPVISTSGRKGPSIAPRSSGKEKRRKLKNLRRQSCG
jgi:hypothetical protein